jgi:hypothetical protein
MKKAFILLGLAACTVLGQDGSQAVVVDQNGVSVVPSDDQQVDQADVTVVPSD